jgi:hypothetical protein
LTRSASILLAFLAIACGPKRIPDTDIEDTPDTREILDVMRRYRHAAEARDAEGLLALASSRFFEDRGTPDPADDYDLDGLRQKLPRDFEKIKTVRMELAIRDVRVEGDKAQVDFFYTTHYLMALPTGETWGTDSDFNRIELLKEDGRWRVASGL